MASGLIADMARSISASALPTVKRAAGAVTRWLPIPQPLLLLGEGASARLGAAVAGFGHKRVLVVSDTMVVQLGLAKPLLKALQQSGVDAVLFDEVTADAPIPVIERGLGRLKAERCDAIVAIGGGSVMDAAKVIGLAAANKKKPQQLAGYFRGLHGPLPLYAVPTTAGTGSEVTVAAVISDPAAGRKLTVIDTRLVPEMAALDPALTLGLPPAVTAATGMDALTHAIEAFISQWAEPDTDRKALAAVAMIWQHLPRAFRRGSDLHAREQMLLASTYAGLAFTRANVGNVHAIAHQLGGKYHTPHGQANAMLLAPVLRFSLDAARPRLAQLARHVGITARGEAAAATAFVDAVQALADRLAIPRTLPALQEADLPALADAACHEADLNYPVPRRMAPEDAMALLRPLLPTTPASRRRTPAAVRRRS